jgi:subtilisin family serine protease
MNRIPQDFAVKAISALILLILFSVKTISQAPLVVVSESELRDGKLYDAWVEFLDKDVWSQQHRTRILNDLEKNFNSRALERRKKRRTLPGLFDEKDFPVSSKYLAGVKSTGAKIRVISNWMNGATILADKKQITAIKRLPYVITVTDFHESIPRKMLDTTPLFNNLLEYETTGVYGYSETQNKQLGLDRMHKAGYAGKGIIIAVIDCGFDIAHETYKNPDHPLKITSQWDFVENDWDVIPRPGIHVDNYDHGTIVLSAIASYAPGKMIGTAYEADFILCNAEDGPEEYYLEERWFTAALEFAESQGADIATSSLVLYRGYTQDQLDGKTSVMTQGMNIAVGNGMICFNGAGNYGNDGNPETSRLLAPADAFDVITVGAVDRNGKITDFSSDGPTIDGRLKPEVLALGFRTTTIALNHKNYTTASGTSLATPVMAGAVACLLQARPGLTTQELRNVLFHSGDYYKAHGRPDSLFIQGYGIPDIYSAAKLKN